MDRRGVREIIALLVQTFSSVQDSLIRTPVYKQILQWHSQQPSDSTLHKRYGSTSTSRYVRKTNSTKLQHCRRGLKSRQKSGHFCEPRRNESLQLNSCNRLDSFSQGYACDFTTDTFATILVFKRHTFSTKYLVSCSTENTQKHFRLLVIQCSWFC